MYLNLENERVGAHSDRRYQSQGNVINFRARTREVAWPSGQGGGLQIRKSRVQVLL